MKRIINGIVVAMGVLFASQAVCMGKDNERLLKELRERKNNPSLAKTMVQMKGADLRGVQLQGQRVANINFNGANLTGANLSSVTIPFANFTKANLTRANFIGATIKGVFESANVQEANFEHANLNGSDFNEVQNFTTTRLLGADFSGVTGLTDAEIQYARRQGANNLPVLEVQLPAAVDLKLLLISPSVLAYNTAKKELLQSGPAFDDRVADIVKQNIDGQLINTPYIQAFLDDLFAKKLDSASRETGIKNLQNAYENAYLYLISDEKPSAREEQQIQQLQDQIRKASW